MTDILDPIGNDDSFVEPIDDLLEPYEGEFDDADLVSSDADPDPLAGILPAASASPANPKPQPKPVAATPRPSVKSTQPIAKVVSDEPAEAPRRKRFLMFTAAPAWLISTLFHLVLLLALGLITLTDPIKVINVLTANPSDQDGPEMEEFVIEEMDPGEMAEMEEFVEPSEQLSEQLEMAEPLEMQPMEFASVEIPLTDMASEMAPSMSSLQTLASMSTAPMGSRSADMKQKMLREYGGTKSSEAAVTEALKWFSRHQAPNGNWTTSHNLVCNGACGDPGEPQYTGSFNAATAMALLPFMGAGQTHLVGDFKGNVDRGLNFLIRNGKPGVQRGLPVFDLRDENGNMYSHGLAAIALCEAYAMTGDDRLLAPAQGAINFIVYAQCADGGWRYSPQQADGGDTSVVGWQLMALKSAHMGHLIVPPITVEGSKLFLDRVGSDSGSIYGYDKPSDNLKPSTTAVGLLCRMYTGWDKTHPGIIKGVDHLADTGVLKDNIYYNYYAAQVLRQYGGEQWDNFNIELRDFLVSTQSQEAGAQGSWHFPNKGHSVERMAGRLGCTAFATMILEVYYRHMPLYADAAADDDFPL